LDDPALALILEECLALLNAGEDPASIAARFPDFSDTLLPMLNVALQLMDEAEDALDDPIDFLRELGEYLQNQIVSDSQSEN
jgi:hypothetical protein